MQGEPLHLEIAQFLASHRKNYPWGVVKGEPIVIAAVPQVLFLSASAFTEPETLLLQNAAEKGLKLSAGAYCIACGSFNISVSEVESVVVLGECSVPADLVCRKVIRTHSIKDILSSPEVKRAFWEDIKVLAGG